MGGRRLLKRNRRQHYHPLGAGRELIQQPMIGDREFGEAAGAIEGFHLPKLRYNYSRSHSVELIPPRTEVQVPPLLVDGVAFPGHAAEARGLLRQGKPQTGFEIAGFLHPDQIGLASHNHDLVCRDLEFAILKNGRSRWRSGGVAEAVQNVFSLGHPIFRKGLDLDIAEGYFCFAVSMNLQGDVSIEGNARGGFRVVHRPGPIDE